MNSEKFMVIPERQTPVIEADVFVAGAGTAGCIAAIAAARAGAKTVLVEKMPVPTGTFANGGDCAFSFYAAEVDPSKAKRIVGGIPYELMLRLDEAGGSTGFMPTGNNPHHSPFDIFPNHEVLKGVLSEMLLEEGIEVYLQTMFCGVITDRSKIKAALIENKNGRSAVVAKQYIDATGDGDIARFAGLEQLENWQHYNEVCGAPTGLVFGLGGIDFDRAMKEEPKGFSLRYDSKAEGKETGVKRYTLAHIANPERYKPLVDLDINFFTSFSSLHPGEATYINNSKGVMTDASKAENLSKAEMEMRVKIKDMSRALRECVPGFENSYMVWAAIQLGIRSSKITECDKMLTQQEISDATRFDDEIGLYGFHDLAPKRPHCLVKEPGFYGFPYRMLLPKGLDNLYMAGRCVTFDLEAHMSTRNVVGCMLMGQGAGVAAALCAAKDCESRQLPYAQLREALLAQDVILNS